jgi:hypothetical protein
LLATRILGRLAKDLRKGIEDGSLAATPSTGEPPESAVAHSDQAAFDDVAAAVLSPAMAKKRSILPLLNKWCGEGVEGAAGVGCGN